jgi:hypothetical protein
MSAEKSAGVRDGILQAFAFDTTETPPEVTFLKERRLGRRSYPQSNPTHATSIAAADAGLELEGR